jgi:hypothetical protein
MFSFSRKSKDEREAESLLAKLAQGEEPLSSEQIESFMQDIKGPLKQHEQ